MAGVARWQPMIGRSVHSGPTVRITARALHSSSAVWAAQQVSQEILAAGLSRHMLVVLHAGPDPFKLCGVDQRLPIACAAVPKLTDVRTAEQHGTNGRA